MQFLAGGRQETMTRDANVALLDMIGTPVILLTHSQGGGFGWMIADARPNLVKAIVTLGGGGTADQGRGHREGGLQRWRWPELGHQRTARSPTRQQ